MLLPQDQLFADCLQNTASVVAGTWENTSSRAG